MCPSWFTKLSPTSGRQTGLKAARSTRSSENWVEVDLHQKEVLLTKAKEGKVIHRVGEVFVDKNLAHPDLSPGIQQHES